MSTPSSAAVLEPQLRPGCPPTLSVEHGGDPATWVAEHKDPLRALLLEHGAVLVRGLGLDTAAAAGAVFASVAATGLIAERESFAPRQPYGDNVYSSTKWPANQQMCMHNELSYLLAPPGLLQFACLTAPEVGGATAVSDAEAVLAALPDDLVDRFDRVGWLLTRNYNDDIGASYADAFGTSDRGAIERYCRDNKIDWEWQDDGGLRTRQRRSAVLAHPVTGRRCWFNQIAFLNEWTLAPEIREYLVDVYGSDGLPFNTSFGDGEPIGEELVALINEVYEAHTLREPWQCGDLLLVDNVRSAHSREPFEGPREVLAALADPVVTS